MNDTAGRAAEALLSHHGIPTMEQLQSLTIVKTDVRRFTDRVEKMTAQELDVFLRDHRALVGGLLREHGGTVIKEIGDSFLAVFKSSTQALRAAVALQREVTLAEAGKAAEAAVELRIAVAAGDVLLQDGDVFGTPVNTVARLEAMTPPGEVYFTEAVWQNVVRGEIAADYVDTFQLKGLTEPVKAYRTTFRHQTRMLHNVTVLVTDLSDFTAWAEQAELAAVESQLEFWEAAHKLATTGHGGVIRTVMGDCFLMTFDDAARAIATWKDLQARADAYNADPRSPRPIRFRAGLSVGDVRVFRSAIHGRAANEAFQAESWSRAMGPRCLGLPASVAPVLQREAGALDGLELRFSGDRATLHEVRSDDKTMKSDVSLREVREADLPIFFEQQIDPEAFRMAAFPPREREAFMIHWAKVMVNTTGTVRTIVVGGQAAGHVVAWQQDGERMVGYWLGREHWGKGIASAALALFLEHVTVRPLVARVAKRNIGSLRVLQKNGFAITGEDTFPTPDGAVEQEYVLTLS